MIPGETLFLVVGIVTSLSAFIALVVLIIIAFHHIFNKSELRLEHIKKNGKETLSTTIRGINILFAGVGKRWKNLRTARKGTLIPPSHLAQLPVGIKVIKQNTTRPLVKPCSNCQINVRISAAFCPNCGISLAPPGAMPKPIIHLQPYITEPTSDKLPAIPVTGELDEEVPEVVHIDLMLKVKLYLLWDKAGR